MHIDHIVLDELAVIAQVMFGGKDTWPPLGPVSVVNPDPAHQSIGRGRPEIQVMHHIHVTVGIDVDVVHDPLDSARQLSDLSSLGQGLF